MIHTEEVEYKVDHTNCRGFIAYKKDSYAKPCVLIAHDWSGRSSTFCDKAKHLAEEGYIGFAIDMYGEAKLGETTEEKTNLITPLLQNRSLLAKRMVAAYNTAANIPSVNNNKIAAIGFCFGGLCVLDLARSGSEVKGVVSFHGLLNTPDITTAKKINAKVLVLHGFDDPMVPPETVLQFAKEMTDKQANWQIDMYGHTKHAFTNPNAHDEKLGLEYNAQADKRSAASAKLFFNEIFL